MSRVGLVPSEFQSQSPESARHSTHFKAQYRPGIPFTLLFKSPKSARHSTHFKAQYRSGSPFVFRLKARNRPDNLF
ncbi:pyruvate kinase [Sesbania bispinosa]|nr:pyruvate kinase [Sesbania bispinosa]